MLFFQLWSEYHTSKSPETFVSHLFLSLHLKLTINFTVKSVFSEAKYEFRFVFRFVIKYRLQSQISGFIIHQNQLWTHIRMKGLQIRNFSCKFTMQIRMQIVIQTLFHNSVITVENEFKLQLQPAWWLTDQRGETDRHSENKLDCHLVLSMTQPEE